MSRTPNEQEQRIKMRVSLEIPLRVEGRVDAATSWIQQALSFDFDVG